MHKAVEAGAGGEVRKTTAGFVPVRIVLDTSVFTNPDTSRQWGETPALALAEFLRMARRLSGQVDFYMPPLIFEELRTFVGLDAFPASFELTVSLRPPNRHAVVVPGFLLYELIDEIRERINRGLRVAERAVRQTQPENVERTITRLREKYREALRVGLIDSKEDVDLILLAYDLQAALVSSDQGVVTWAEKLGIRRISPEGLRRVLEESLDDVLAIEQAMEPRS